MKKITFKVSSSKVSTIVSLIKEINKFTCKILLDIENGFVVVEIINDSMIEDVIDLVDKYFSILNIDIDNTFEEAMTVDNEAVVEAVEEPSNVEKDAVVAEKQATVLETQSEDALIIKNVEFENEYVGKRINNLLNTAYWSMHNKNATEKEIGDYILTCECEISMRYTHKPIIEFKLGDIVDANYGSHLPGEIMGGHVHGIVCNILNKEMAYVVPITKLRTDITSKSYLFMGVPYDATYDNEFYKGGTVLVDKGKYLRAERFNSVIGKTTPEFFEKLLYQLASTFDFTNCLPEKVGVNSPSYIGQTTDGTEETIVKLNTTTKKVGREESALLEVIGFAFDKLDSSKKVEEQVEPFLTAIGMTTTERMVTQAFIVTCDIKKINYENVILRLHETFPNVKEKKIENILKEAFKNWLDKYHPTLSEKCPKISLMSVLKVFARRISNLAEKYPKNE